jgi:hypothetical protein
MGLGFSKRAKHMRYWAPVVALCMAAIFAPVAAQAEGDYGYDDPWTVRFFTGPFSTKYLGAIVVSANMHPTALYTGVSLDRHLLYLGWGTFLIADGELGETWFGHHDTQYGGGLGLQINGPFGFTHSTLTLEDGASWDTSPPHVIIGYHEKVFGYEDAQFLNYMVVEDAIALTRDGKWDGVIRLYHRSGMFGVFNIDDTEGTTIGLGVRYRF